MNTSPKFKLTRRHRYLLQKFKEGFVAKAHRSQFTATIKPPAGVRANNETAHVDTLDALAKAGYLLAYQEINLTGRFLVGHLVWVHNPD